MCKLFRTILRGNNWAGLEGKPKFRLYSIDKTVGKGRGKANVLGQLAHHATGEFYFITDVDVKLPANWIAFLNPRIFAWRKYCCQMKCWRTARPGTVNSWVLEK